MTEQGNFIVGGLSEEVWAKLEEKWGTTAKDFRKLNFFRNYQGIYKHCNHVPPHILDRKHFIRDNDKIHILEIRYGSIPGENSGKPCIWVYLKHEHDPDGQLSPQAQPQIWLNLKKNQDQGHSIWEPIGEDVPVTVFKRDYQQGLDKYILASKVFEVDDWLEIETKLSGDFLRSTPFSVHIHNSQRRIYYIPGGIWVVDEIPV